MSKADPLDDGLLPEYDFSQGVRGKYAAKYADGQMVVMVILDADVAAHFPSSESVNKALRGLVQPSKTS